MMLMVIGGYYMTMRKVGEEPHVECLKYDNSVSAWEILHYRHIFYILSVLHQNKGGIGKSNPNARGSREILRAGKD